MKVKEGKQIVSVRSPHDVVDWCKKRADYVGGTVSAEFVSAVRERMEREAQKALADRAAAGE
jgi:hypothetical protein